MDGFIDAVSASGLGFRIAGQTKGEWFNKGKTLARDFKGLKKGDRIQFDAADGKWVSAWKLDGEAGDAGTESPAPTAPLAAAEKVFGGSAKSTQKSDGMSRGCAAHAIFESPYMGEVLKGETMEETVQNLKDFAVKMSEWVCGGSW